MKLFRHRSKPATPDAGSPLPDAGTVPVAAPEASPMTGTAQPGDAGTESALPLSPAAYRLPDLFALPWAGDEIMKSEETWHDGTLVVRVEMPGIDPERDVRLTVADGRLAIEAERREEGDVERDGMTLRELRYTLFSRSLPLPAGVIPTSITATYTDGVLEIRVPVAAVPAPGPARIPITIA